MKARPLADWRLSPSRMRLLALVSALTTGLVIWAGLSGEGPGRLAAAVARHRMLLGSATAAAAARQPPESAAEASSSGEASSEAAPAPEEASAPPESPSAVEPASAVQSPAPEPAPSTTQPAPAPRKPAANAAPAASKIKHVFVIALASPGYEQTWGPGSAATYLVSKLRPQGALLSNYYAVAHPDLPNYIAMISGQPPNALTETDCPTFAEFPAGSKPDASGRLEAPGCLYPVEVLTVADQLTSTRRQVLRAI